jgi:hypothetical protein
MRKLHIAALLFVCLLVGVAFDCARAETTVTITSFNDALDPYGYWVEDPGYGRVWRPSRVSDDWGPYTRGNWVYTREYGWVWVSDEPYGWIVYHYGHWVWSDRYGWVWVAGADWSPAWVEWCYGGGYVSWEPMPPDPSWQGAYYYGSYDCSSPAYYSRAVFVSETYFGRPGMRSHYVPRSQSGMAASATVNVTAYSRGRNGPINRGIDVRKLEASTGQPIAVVPVAQSNGPMLAPADTVKQLRIFRPTVTGFTAPKLEVPATAKLERPNLDTPPVTTLDLPDAEPSLGPLSTEKDLPVPSGTSPGGIPDVGRDVGSSMPSVGGALGGVRGVLGR